MDNNEKIFEIEKAFTYKTDKKLFEMQDALDIGRMKIIALDYSAGTGPKTVSATAYLNWNKAKRLAEDVLSNYTPDTKDSVGNSELLSETKINAQKVDETTGLSPVTVVTIVKNGPKMGLRYKITAERGLGKAQRTGTGGTKLEKGSYKKIASVQVFLSDSDMRLHMTELKWHLESNRGRIDEYRKETAKKEKRA